MTRHIETVLMILGKAYLQATGGFGFESVIAALLALLVGGFLVYLTRVKGNGNGRQPVAPTETLPVGAGHALPAWDTMDAFMLQLSSANKSIADLRARVADVEGQNQRLQDALGTSNAERARLEVSIKVLQRLLSDATVKIDSLQHDVELLRLGKTGIAMSVASGQDTIEDRVRSSRAFLTMLVDALLECPSISDAGRRAAIVADLPDNIQRALTHSSNAHDDVANLVTIASKYSRGLDELLARLEDSEQDSIPYRAVQLLVQGSGGKN